MKEAEEIVVLAQSYAPQKTRELAESIHVSQLIDKGEGVWRVEIVADAPHAAAHEHGSGLHAEPRAGVAQKPYVIVPNRGSVLIFEWPSAPAEVQEVSSKFPTVHLRIIEHPGVKGVAYLRRALRERSKKLWSQIVVSLTEG